MIVGSVSVTVYPASVDQCLAPISGRTWGYGTLQYGDYGGPSLRIVNNSVTQ